MCWFCSIHTDIQKSLFYERRIYMFKRYMLTVFLSMLLCAFFTVSLYAQKEQVNIEELKKNAPKGGASFEEILLQRRELATSYSYFASVGLSYSFGSIFSNVVNPRFGN